MTIDEFSSLVVEKRKNSGLTQWDYAEKIGCSWLTIWRWENKECMPKVDAIDHWIKKIKQS